MRDSRLVPPRRSLPSQPGLARPKPNEVGDRLVGAAGAKGREQAPCLGRGLRVELADSSSDPGRVLVRQHGRDVADASAGDCRCHGQEHVKEAVVLEPGVGGPVPDRVVQAGRAFERQPLLGKRHQAPCQRLLVGKCLGRDTSGPQLDQVPMFGDDPDAVRGELRDRYLDEGRGAGEWYRVQAGRQTERHDIGSVSARLTRHWPGDGYLHRAQPEPRVGEHGFHGGVEAANSGWQH